MDDFKSLKTKSTQSDRPGVINAVQLAFEMPAAAASAPEWVQIFPAGPVVATVDGRAFVISAPENLAASINARSREIMVDYDHRSHFEPFMGGDQRAAGWVNGAEVRDGAIWARITWVPSAAEKIMAREYRYVSPEFSTDSETGEVIDVRAIGLVNRPAFIMSALAAANSGETQVKTIALALGLPETASAIDIVGAINAGKAELASAKAAPSLAAYVPRSDYDVVLARATTAETELAVQRAAGRDAEIETVLAAAVSEGKIAPASKAHYVALAKTSDAGFAEVSALCGTLPKVIADPNIQKTGAGDGAMTDYEVHIASSLGVSREDFLKHRATT